MFCTFPLICAYYSSYVLFSKHACLIIYQQFTVRTGFSTSSLILVSRLLTSVVSAYLSLHTACIFQRVIDICSILGFNCGDVTAFFHLFFHHLQVMKKTVCIISPVC